MKPLYKSLALAMAIFSFSVVNSQTVFINELHYDNSGGDIDEGVEIAGPTSTDLSGWLLVLYNGNGGTVYNTISLSGTLTDQQSGIGTSFFSIAGLQNGSPDGVALVDDTNTLIQFLSYEGVITGVGGIADGLISEDIGVTESGSTTLGTSLQLTGQGSNYADFVWASGLSSTYNTVNESQTFGAGGAIMPLINEFVANHTGSDTNEFIEITGGQNTDYSAYSLIEIEGDGTSAGVVDEVITLGTTDADGYWTTGFLSNAIENGTVSLFVVENFSGSAGDDLDTDNDGVLDATPWDTIADAVGVNDGGASDHNYGGSVLTQNFDGGSFTVGGASRIPNGIDSDTANDWTRNDFDGQGLPDYPAAIAGAGEAINTPGSENGVASGPVADVIINEVDADTEGTDIAEFVELYDGGTGNTLLDGLVLVFYNGSNDQVYRAIDLDGNFTSSEGYFVLGNAGVPNVSLTFPSNGLQNGADAVALYEGDDVDFPSGTAVTTQNLVDALVYDTDDSDDLGLLALLNAGESQVNENSNGQKDTESLQRIPNGSGGPRNTSTYIADAPTPGAENGAVIVPPGAITIAEARETSEGEVVTVRGVLTAVGSFGGPAYMQDATAGIAVFDPQLHDNMAFQVGDSVEITAERGEFNSQVQLGGISNLVALGAANNPIQPAVITLAQLQDHPGQLVEVVDVSFSEQSYILFGNSNFQVSDMSGAGELRIDADVESLVGKAQPAFCSDITGIVGRFIDIYQLLPRSEADMPCAEDYEPIGDDLDIPQSSTFDIVTWNIEWFGDENNSPAAGDPDSDAIQKDSVKAVILELNPDMLAVQEITDTTLFVQMVSELPGYDYFISNFVSYPDGGGEKQHLAFLYKTGTVQPIAAESRALLASIHPYYNGGDGSALVGYPAAEDRFYASGRLPYLLVVNATIEGVTRKLHIVNVHARANSGSESQNRYDMRKYDVEVLKDSLDTYYADANVILLGDYNDDVDFTVADIPSTISSYAEYANDEINYTISTEVLSLDGFRSYVFNNDVIDHISVSDELTDQVLDGSARVGYQFYDSDYANTTSDHMPVSLRIEFVPEVTFNSSKAIAITSFNQGKRKNGRPVVWWRSNPDKALGRPLENFYYNFVSLGFGGDITLELDENLYDLEGDDFKVFESTLGVINLPCYLYPEKAEVFASADGQNFTSLGTTCLDGRFDLADGQLQFAKYIRIADVSDRAHFGRNADGYDLDGIWPINPAGSGARSAGASLPEDYENYAPNEEGDLEISAYPNPFVDHLKVSLISEGEEMNVRIYNVMGHEVFQKVMVPGPGAHEFGINLSHMPDGVYLLKIGEEQTLKLIKE